MLKLRLYESVTACIIEQCIDCCSLLLGVNVTDHFHRRHSRWYEVILFNFWFQLIVGAFFVVLTPHFIRWETLLIKSINWDFVQINTLIMNSIAFFTASIALKRMQKFPGSRSIGYIFLIITLSWLSISTLLLFLRLEYTRSILLLSYTFANIWAFLGFFIGRKYYKPKLAIVPFGRALELADTKQAVITILESPNLGKRRYDAIVADLHSTMPDEWQRFLAECTLARIPVYHTKQLLENFTGRVKIDHLSENIFGVLHPSPMYEFIKRALEIIAVLITAPIWLPIMLITGIIIKLESKGPMFFIQERVGRGNQDFNVYKLRSMCQDSEKNGAQFAQANDMRVTRVGRFIRKTRIDEIPQFINVLKGDMSLIGPRPEQRTFVTQFEKEIPFYAYRHVVRPGITGWAQVTQGYAADADETRLKLEHDFFYIKHFSLWLDILIVFKTIRTMLTGFGAR